MNLGLVTPAEIIAKVMARADEVPPNSLKGVVRQVIGWREFVRGIYRTHGDEQLLQRAVVRGCRWFVLALLPRALGQLDAGRRSRMFQAADDFLSFHTSA